MRIAGSACRPDEVLYVCYGQAPFSPRMGVLRGMFRRISGSAKPTKFGGEASMLNRSTRTAEEERHPANAHSFHDNTFKLAIDTF